MGVCTFELRLTSIPINFQDAFRLLLQVKNEKTELQASLAEKSLPAAVSSFSTAQVMQQCRSLVLRSAV